MSTVSVVIPAHNAAPYLRQALESVFGQTRPPEEIVVVDDASSDETPALLASFRGRVKAVRGEYRNVGAARNRGVKESAGDYIAFLDADDLWRPEKLERFMDAAAADPSVDLVFSDARSMDADGRPRRRVRTGPAENLFARLVAGGRLVTSATMVRRALFDAGGFREDFRCPAGVEDWEFWLRAARRAPARHLPRALTLYRVHGASAIQTRRFDLRDDALRALALHAAEAPAPLLEEGKAWVHYESAARHLAALDIPAARGDLAEAARHPALRGRARRLRLLSAAGPVPLRFFLALRRLGLRAALFFTGE